MPQKVSDTEWITGIYHRQIDTVYRICYSYMKNQADTEDMVQETFLRLIRTGKTFENDRHEKAWLIVTASNLCKDQRKHWWRKSVGLEEAIIASGDHEREWDVLMAVLSLPEGYKTVVYMHYYEGYSTREIAQYLHCTEGTVRSRLTRARQKLKAKLGGSRDE